ncbi:hypothetical protein EGR_08931 [Echinococcus granulosus]|uniref:Uncharacterized protein n=1 Tax=Echinococcus granulosus TaxID=6210 RepID=W6U4V2_ECHGR|nr:hypothetical protein EGR_08931 [Echinococcus granulosus]EUB56183.1 hypothetical protein EGR_08931 [Echinococcus granulosus]
MSYEVLMCAAWDGRWGRFFTFLFKFGVRMLINITKKACRIRAEIQGFCECLERMYDADNLPLLWLRGWLGTIIYATLSNSFLFLSFVVSPYYEVGFSEKKALSDASMASSLHLYLHRNCFHNGLQLRPSTLPDLSLLARKGNWKCNLLA